MLCRPFGSTLWNPQSYLCCTGSGRLCGQLGGTAKEDLAAVLQVGTALGWHRAFKDLFTHTVPKSGFPRAMGLFYRRQAEKHGL